MDRKQILRVELDRGLANKPGRYYIEWTLYDSREVVCYEGYRAPNGDDRKHLHRDNCTHWLVSNGKLRFTNGLVPPDEVKEAFELGLARMIVE